jgi:sugar transferase EpsL
MPDLRARDLRIKRASDLVMATVGAVLLAPVLAVIWAAVRLTMGEPVLFRQWRPGLDQAPFRIMKFRTMVEHHGGGALDSTDESRMTPLGRFLREYSLDELPELFNVVKGDMSLVGPRPLLMEHLDAFTPEQARRQRMRPGITGWAQIQGRRALPLSKRLELDVWYVDHWSLRLDARILFATIPSIVRDRGHIVGQTIADVDDIGLTERGRSTEDGEPR